MYNMQFFSCLPAVLLSVSVLASESLPIYTPIRVRYKDLSTADNVAFLEPLKEFGIVSITDIPSWNKQSLFDTLELCISENQVPDVSHTFSDETLRRTLATRSIAGRPEPLFDDSIVKELQNECIDRLQKESVAFRHVVQDVTEAVAARLNELAVDENGNPVGILYDSSGEQHYDFHEVVSKGEHLEHLHCYYERPHHSSQVSAKDAPPATIDWHTDQGLLLVFTPGQRRGQTTGGFFIQLADGSAVEVEFDVKQDDLVVMLGDGVNQYVNPALKESGNKSIQLRAVPHALHMSSVDESPEIDGNSPRIWYGRMVLPPHQALHPTFAGTFQDMRSAMINKDPKALMLGCASQQQIARELADGDGDTMHCSNATSSLCWHECMNYTDFDVSPEICEERSLSLGCVNDEGFLWVDTIHDPAFQLGCVNLSEAEFAEVPEADASVPAPTTTDSAGYASLLGATAVGFVGVVLQLLHLE